MKQNLPFLLFLAGFFLPWISTSAQFHTITDTRAQCYEIINRNNTIKQSLETQIDTIEVSNTFAIKDTVQSATDTRQAKSSVPLTRTMNINSYCTARKKLLDYNRLYGAFPDLTLNNLLMEIRKNGIQYENVVLAQAILETGWFTSSVCRNKKNLFGLTNPRTGEYYEFDRWQDSVKAYYTKVQYKYKGGNYLLWLDRLPYAESTTYVMSLINILKQYFI